MKRELATGNETETSMSSASRLWLVNFT